MFKICLSKFISTPWSERLTEIVFNALKSTNKSFIVDKIDGYPTKEYDAIFLCGIRTLTIKNLDIFKIRGLCKYIIEFGDTIDDPRDRGADLYFFFNPSEKKIDGRKYLPKLINEEELYSEHSQRLTIYIDHYKHQNLNEAEMSRKAILFVFEQIQKFKNLNVPFDFYFHSENGIEINPSKINLPGNKSQNCKLLDYKEITKYYRKTHLFFPTHRETQGMLAQEIAMCGGLTVLQPWMYPKTSHYQFRHFLYDFENPIDVHQILKILNDKNFINDNRKHVQKYCSSAIFNKTFIHHVINLLKSE